MRALPPEEREQVLAALHEPRFVDLAPAQVYATLLDEDRYLCSERTFYRVLAANAEVRERRDQLRHPHYAAPELLATRPNELWSWDTTKLLGPTKWPHYYLDVVLDVFSRYTVGWMLAQRESAWLAMRSPLGGPRDDALLACATLPLARSVSAYRANAVGTKCSGEGAELRGPRRTTRLAGPGTAAHSATPKHRQLVRQQKRCVLPRRVVRHEPEFESIVCGAWSTGGNGSCQSGSRHRT